MEVLVDSNQMQPNILSRQVFQQSIQGFSSNPASSRGIIRRSSDGWKTRASDIPVLYLDGEVLVINKPSGLICDYDPKVWYLGFAVL